MTLSYTYNTSQLVSTIPRKQYINNGQVKGSVMGMPQKFSGADGGNSFALGRLTYINSYSNGGGKREVTDNTNPKGKPVVSQSSGQHIERKKNNAIGRGSVNRNTDGVIQFKSVDQNLVNSKLGRTRSAGYVAPPKKSANKTKN